MLSNSKHTIDDEDKIIPNGVRYSIIVGAVFVFWVFYDTLFTPIQRHMWADPELLNAVGIYLIPTSFFVIVYWVMKYYGRKATSNIKDNKSSCENNS